MDKAACSTITNKHTNTDIHTPLVVVVELGFLI